MITQTDDIVEEERMMALLDANERLTDVLARATAGPSKPTLSLAGLGFRFGMGHQQNGAGFTGGGGRPSPLTMSSSSSFSSSDPDEVFDDTDGLRTPRMDKGKRKAVPEPEEHEKVLSPIAGLPPEDLAKGDYFGISGRRPEGEEEEEEERERRLAEARAELAASEGGGNEEVDPDAENVCDSPTTDRSRSWVEEEGEVFRKGNVLLGEAEMEGEWAGEELRKEV
jgi:protein phosphatase 1 regulatory subunit 37